MAILGVVSIPCRKLALIALRAEHDNLRAVGIVSEVDPNGQPAGRVVLGIRSALVAAHVRGA